MDSTFIISFLLWPDRIVLVNEDVALSKSFLRVEKNRYTKEN